MQLELRCEAQGSARVRLAACLALHMLQHALHVLSGQTALVKPEATIVQGAAAARSCLAVASLLSQQVALQMTWQALPCQLLCRALRERESSAQQLTAAAQHVATAAAALCRAS